jgi:hydrogenase expression/formation protein HypC
MCLGIPARVVTVGEQHPDLAIVDMAGIQRSVNIGLLDGPDPVRAGDWILVHMGFALSLMTEREADDAMQALDAERATERALIASMATEEDR